MVMRMQLPELWESLTERGAGGHEHSKLLGRMLASGDHVRVFATARPSSGAIGVAFELASGLVDATLLPPPAKRIAVALIPGEGKFLATGTLALLVELADGAYRDLFSHLATYLAQAAISATTAKSTVSNVLAAIDHWARFMDRSTPLLSEAEAKGLVGELSVLERLCDKVGPASALDAWRAPSGSLRDFESPHFTVEVKAFSPSSGATVRINDPLQLEPDPGVPLYLACTELSESGSEEHTLPGHAERVSRLFSGHQSLAERYWLLLASAGCPRGAGPSVVGTYRWRAGAHHVFLVEGDFPRIHPDSVPSEVSTLRFSLDVFALSRFSVDADQTLGLVKDR